MSTTVPRQIGDFGGSGRRYELCVTHAELPPTIRRDVPHFESEKVQNRSIGPIAFDPTRGFGVW
jgi:hypothetical protein